MPPKSAPTSATDRPEVGAVYAFHTTPHNAFSRPDTGRYAALVVLGVQGADGGGAPSFAVGLLDGVWPRRPTGEEVAAAPLLIKARPGWVKQAAAYRMSLGFDWAPEDLRDFHRIDTDRVPSAQDLAEAERIFAPASLVPNARLIAFDEMAEGEWRWRHDRDALEAELEQVKARREADRLAYEARVRDRLSGLTWDQLLSESPFAHWTPSPPFPPPAFTAAARDTLHETCRALAALGPKPRKAATRKLLKACVAWFNAADARDGHVIETEEREDIWTVLEEMANVAGHPALMAEVDAWRDW